MPIGSMARVRVRGRATAFSAGEGQVQEIVVPSGIGAFGLAEVGHIGPDPLRR